MKALDLSGRSRASLAFRFNLFAGVALVLIAAVSAYIDTVSQRSALLGEMERQSGRLAKLLGANVANALFTFDSHGLGATVDAFMNDQAVRLVEIKDNSGKVVKASGEPKEKPSLALATQNLKVGGDVIGSVILGLSTASVDQAVSASWRLLLVREAITLALIWSVLCYLVRWLIARPLGEMNEVLQQAEATGDLTFRLRSQREDEIGELAHWFNLFIEKLESMVRSIGNNAQLLGNSSAELEAVSQQMSSRSEETVTQANRVSAASEQVSKNVRTVAVGAEEMSASIKEIAKNTSEAARVAKEAVEVAQKTYAMISKLGASGAEIGNVIKVITSIAEQTNLLALNATIEAARAGETGKGFAVVANEVKELARQTGDATEDIRNKIGAIQQDTRGAVAAIEQIGGIINQIDDITDTITSAVEEQSATTNDIGRNVMEAAKGSNAIAQNLTGVAQAAQATASGASQTQTAAQELARLASALQAAVSQFKYEGEGQEMKPAARMREQTPEAPRRPRHQPKPAYRPAGATLHDL